MFQAIGAILLYTMFTFVVVVLEKDSKHIKSDHIIEPVMEIDSNRRGVDTIYIYNERV